MKVNVPACITTFLTEEVRNVIPEPEPSNKRYTGQIGKTSPKKETNAIKMKATFEIM